MSRKNRSGRSRRNNRNKNSQEILYLINEEANNFNDFSKINNFFEKDVVDRFNKKQNKKIEITPRTENQKKYVDLLSDDNKPIIISSGPAGTGKTMLAAQVAVKGLVDGRYDKIVVTRPTVGADEDIGFLPGSKESKMSVWVQPVIDVLEEIYTQQEIQQMIKNKIICVESLSFMRGRTFKKAFIIGDEFQNTTPEQMKMMLTRIGEGSKLVVTGDLNQHDRKSSVNGLSDFISKLNVTPSPMISTCHFSKSDIQRHIVIDHILKLYGEE